MRPQEKLGSAVIVQLILADAPLCHHISPPELYCSPWTVVHAQSCDKLTVLYVVM